MSAILPEHWWAINDMGTVEMTISAAKIVSDMLFGHEHWSTL
jgi:hypothetical protein